MDGAKSETHSSPPDTKLSPFYSVNKPPSCQCGKTPIPCRVARDMAGLILDHFVLVTASAT